MDARVFMVVSYLETPNFVLYHLSDTRNQFDMYSFVSQSWCAFWQKNDMLLKWSIVKSTSDPKPQRKAYHLKDTALLWDFKIFFVRNPMICFYEWVYSISRKTISFFCQKAHHGYRWIGKHIIVVYSVMSKADM